MTIISLIITSITISFILIGCGGGGGSTPIQTPASVTVTCPNSTSKTAATLTEANALCAAPLLVSISPPDGATSVATDTARIDVKTDSSLDTSSITTTNITLKAGSSIIAGSVGAVGTNGFSFSISSKLNFAQQYMFSATVKDTAGKVLEINTTFSTASISCLPPQIPNSVGTECISPIINLLATKPQLLPDLRAKYNALCGNDVSVQNALVANLKGHKDGKKDLVFNLWCGQNPVGSITTAPTVNGLIALTQQPDGSFLDETKKLFGAELIDLIGVANRAVVYDFNNDGYDDIVLAVTGEDGRALPVGDTSSNRQNVFITSSSNGTYRVERLGKYSYNHQIQLKDNQFGGKDVVTENIGYGGGRSAWRYLNGWTEISGYDWLNFVAVFFDRRSPATGAPAAITQSTTLGGLDLFTSDGYDNWIKRSTWSFPNVTTVPMKGWNGDMGSATIMNIDGKDYVSVVFELGCQLKKSPSDDPIAIMALNTNEIIGGYQGGTVIESDGKLKPVTKLMGFSPASNTLKNIPLTINNEMQYSRFFAISCEDVNNDGYQDITVMPWGSDVIPFIYLNDKSGRFNLIEPRLFPKSSSTFQDNSMLYVDLDGDGIKDLLYWPLTRLKDNPTTVQYEIYKGIRHLDSNDIKKQ